MSELDEALASLRSRLDDIDRGIVESLAARFAVTREIGHIKAGYGAEPLQPGRHQAVVESRSTWGQEAGLDPDATKRIFEAILTESVSGQQQPSTPQPQNIEVAQANIYRVDL